MSSESYFLFDIGMYRYFGLVYRGFNISPTGSIIGLASAFVDGLICGALFAWLYNTVAARRRTSEI